MLATHSQTVAFFCVFPMWFLASCALGGAAGTIVNIVPATTRATATAAFFLFATMLGLPSAVAGPVLGGGLGSNFAFGGATTGPLNNVGSVPSLLTQTANFVTALGPASAPANALYVVAGGGNNARAAMTAIAGGADITATIGAAAVQFAADIGSIVDTLQAKGAERIIVWDVPNLGFAPAIAANGPTLWARVE
jgi:phospholipase/lecithinase/hemolysin